MEIREERREGKNHEIGTSRRRPLRGNGNTERNDRIENGVGAGALDSPQTRILSELQLISGIILIEIQKYTSYNGFIWKYIIRMCQGVFY